MSAVQASDDHGPVGAGAATERREAVGPGGCSAAVLALHGDAERPEGVAGRGRGRGAINRRPALRRLRTAPQTARRRQGCHSLPSILFIIYLY